MVPVDVFKGMKGTRWKILTVRAANGNSTGENPQILSQITFNGFIRRGLRPENPTGHVLPQRVNLSAAKKRTFDFFPVSQMLSMFSQSQKKFLIECLYYCNFSQVFGEK